MCLDVELCLVFTILSEQTEQNSIKNSCLTCAVATLDSHNVLAKLKLLAFKALEVGKR
jgi:hypothetical protein